MNNGDNAASCHAASVSDGTAEASSAGTLDATKSGCGCGCKTTHRDPDLKKSLDARLARIEGQVRGLRRMIGEDAYCDDVLGQVSAAQAALGKSALVILEHHMKHCLIDRVRAGETDIVDELVDTLGRML
ncbi:MAG: hypothetical protein A2087_13090 [Spirochaetes bacterium GWD1_61_31]|nr:MAG: hypothetical protein A2Y37_02495 [Spirochaetes bacterium GWB1_60_80]OHD28591.1 MAG: hypothetical protein A2004_03070 [Spirochaetes bacterium GWC1_61_12]OHD39507.1 MAG: hypothetical protein A2087_13090 [Spirochaetes bacterium GWD1_61_31]OHD45560.1 MAG: hypothetical protein A2Y35_02765 [Spirochaetes bacterium GWE1_60_18]OHD58132.1 MAG: hypothetical protein A2Y32_05340 [Spirochaetes bacterium GWF1_60_12]